MRTPQAQEHCSGCGVACLSFLLNISQAEVLKRLKMKHHQATYRGIYCREIVTLLNTSGYKANFRALKLDCRENIYRDGTIVFVQSTQYPGGHYLCRWNGMWMDPWINILIDSSLPNMKAGWRKRLPAKALYAVFLDE
jgi:hypothetical protein